MLNLYLFENADEAGIDESGGLDPQLLGGPHVLLDVLDILRQPRGPQKEVRVEEAADGGSAFQAVDVYPNI